MTAPFLNKNWDITREEINNWFVMNDFENIIHKYDNKQVRWFWRKKRYKDYALRESQWGISRKLERDINKFNRLSWWKKPFVYLFSGINTKRKLLSYFYAKEIIIKARSYYLYQSRVLEDHTVLKNLISKIESSSLIKGMGKHLNKFASSMLYFINQRQNIEEQPNNSSNNQVKPELAPNDIHPVLFDKISEVLDKLNYADIQRWLCSLGIIKGILGPDPNDEKMENVWNFWPWKLYPLLYSDNNYIKKITLFYIILYTLKPALFNYDEILILALNQSPHVKLAINWTVLDSRYENPKEILEILLKYYPANIQSTTLKINQVVGQGRIIKSLPEYITSLKINLQISQPLLGGSMRRSDEYCCYKFALSSILENLPKNVIHLDLSEASLANVDDLSSLLEKIPSTVQTLNISDEQLLKYDDAYLAKAFNALPKHFVKIKLIDKNMSEENKKRLDALKRNLNNRVTQNMSLKEIAVNFIYNYMKGSYDDKTKELQLHQNNKVLIKAVPQDIGDLFIYEQQMSIKP